MGILINCKQYVHFFQGKIIKFFSSTWQNKKTFDIKHLRHFSNRKTSRKSVHIT